MQIHELDNYSGALDSNAYTVIDNGEDTGKLSVPDLLSIATQAIAAANARIDNIIAGGDAPSAAEVTDARLGANGVVYPSLGDAIRSQIDETLLRVYSGSFETGKYLAPNGAIYSDAKCKVTDYVPVLPNDTVYLNIAYPSTEYCYGLYAEDKSQLSIVRYGSATEYAITIPDGVRYIRATYTRANAGAYYFDNLVLTKDVQSLIERILEYRSEYEGSLSSISATQLNFITAKKNLFDEGNINDGYVGNTGNVISGNFYHTDLIPVVPGDVIRFTFNQDLIDQSCQFYDSSETFYQTGRWITSNVDNIYREVTVPNGASYILINLATSQTSYFVIVKNEPYDSTLAGETETLLTLNDGYIFSSEENDPLAEVNNGLFYKKICCIGDSLTEGQYGTNISTGVDMGKHDGYPYFLAKMLDCETENLGRGGMTTKTWWLNKESNFTEEQLDFSRYDCFLIFLGTNGGLAGNPDSSEDSMLGYYCKIIEKCQSEAPNMPIFLIGFPWSNNRTQSMISQLEVLSEATGLPIIHLEESNILTWGKRLENQPFDQRLHYGRLGYLRLASEIKRYMSRVMDDNATNYASIIL